MQLRLRPGIHRLFLVLGLLVVGWSTALALGPIPITNWTAPSTWTPLSTKATGSNALDAYPALPFIPITPCRQYDSRSFSPLPQDTSRFVTLTGSPCGIPTGLTRAVSANITVFNISGATGNGVFKVGTENPPSTAWINYPPTETQRANAGVLTLVGGAIVVQVNQGAGSVDFVVDVNGYYGSSVPAQGNGLFMSGTQDFTSIIGASNTISNTYGTFGFGLEGHVNGSSSSGFPGSAGVIGFAGDNPQTYGVKGTIGSSMPGYPAGSWGVVGGGGDGGVYGQADPARTSSVGVFGQTPSGPFIGGKLGYKTSLASYGVFSEGDFGGTGAKFFVEPHPTDADKVIRYVALEGPEAGTYFRGTAKTVGREAIIEVPESFRFVTDEEGLTVQLTPVGQLAQMAVISRDLNQIVVRSSRDVTFDYHVHGVRRAFRTHEAITDGSEFRPASPSSRLPSYLPEEARKRLVENGTYNRDGTVNLGTAERRGWTKVWEEEALKKGADK